MFVVIGDAHLKSKLWRSRSLEDDAFVAFEQAIRFATQHDAEAIIFPGDTFDPVTSAHMARYQEIMELYDGPVLGIQGQHDYADPCWFQVGGIAGDDLHGVKTSINDVSFYGIENQPRHRVKDLLEEVPPVDFLVLHQLEKSCIPYNNWDLDASWIPDHVGAVLIGDLHQQVGFDFPGGGPALYTGSLVPGKIDEIENDHGFLAVYRQDEKDRITGAPDAQTNKFLFVRQKEEVRYMIRRQAVSEAQAAGLLLETERQMLIQHADDPLAPVLFLKFASTDSIRQHVQEEKDWCAENGIICIAETTARYKKDETIEATIPTDLDMASIVSQATDNSQVQQLVTGLLKKPEQETINTFKRDQFGLGGDDA